MTERNRAQPRPAVSDDGLSGDRPVAGTRGRITRRRLVKAATATVAGVAAASGYVPPSVRPLQVPIAHAFSF
ncbi:MAG: twin-arginine translocation signal domain-containing protein [Chloroflexi bacterium]|nr:twin-arginine translocation signal domain-containing protein [Chloroflexota bacterium]